MDRQKSIFLRKSVLLLLFLLFCAGSVTQAQKKFTEEDEAKIRNQILKIEEEKDKLLPHEKKTESNLRDLIKQMRDDQSKGILDGRTASKKYTNQTATVNEKLQIQIVVSLLSEKDADSTAVKEEITRAGGYTRLVYKTGDNLPVEMYCWVPFNKVLDIAKNPAIGNVSLLGKPVLRAGAKLTEGYGQLNVDKAYQYFGVDGIQQSNGSIIKVGVISDGIKDFNNSFLSHDLNSINIVNSGDPDGNEGTAMMEIIHDIAPKADLYFAGFNMKVEGPNDMANRIDQLMNYPNYCKVIVEDLGFPYTASQFSNDALSLKIQEFKGKSSNNLYISAAGNDGLKCWDGKFTASSQGYNVWSRDNVMGDYINNEIQILPNETVTIYLQWAEKWDYAKTDYDIFLYDSNNNLVTQSHNPQGAKGSIPRETLSFKYESGFAPTFFVRVYFNGLPENAPDKEMRLIVDYSPLQFTYPNFQTNLGRPTGQIYGKELMASVTVGAYSASSTNTIEPYSSRGSSNYYSFDINGMQTDKRPYQVPAITATDNVQTNAGDEFNPFTGTSAAAPHIGGIAALFYSRYPNVNFYQALTQSAASIAGHGGGGVYYDQSGFGKADALECLIYPLSSVPSGTISSSVNWTDVKVNGVVTINSDIVVTVPDKSIAVINGTVNFGNANSKIVVNSGGTLLVRNGAVVDPSHVTGDGNIYFDKYLLVEQVAEDNSSLGSLSFKRWETGSNFVTYTSPKYFLDLNVGDNVVLQANQGVSSGKKYRFWEKDYASTGSIINHQSFSYNNPTVRLSAIFSPTNNATIQSKIIEGGNSGGKLKFMDPWVIDFTDILYLNTLRNQGMAASFKDVNYSANNLGPNTAYKGMFLGLDPSQGAQFFYSVQAPMVQTDINGKTGYFQYWNTSNATLKQNGTNPTGFDQKAVVFNGSDAFVTAYYKGLHLSNYSSALVNSGQKKTKSDGANSILVYESMNSIWMENSTDKGATWSLLNNYKSVNPSGIAKDPSIDGTDGADHFYLVGYASPDAQANTTNIMATEISGLSTVTGTKVVYSNIPGSTYDTQPVVACLSTSKGQRAIMIWRQPATEGFGEMLPAGLYYRTGSVVSGSNGNEINWDVYHNGIYIAGTDINSFNPTVAGVRSLNDIQTEIPMVFHLSYSQKIGDQSAIRYTSLTLKDDGTIDQSKTQVLSDPLYYGYYKQLNEKPSITLVKNVPYVAWRNYHEATYMQSAVLRWKLGDTTWADTRHFAGKDDDATSVHISNVGYGGSGGYPDFVLAWNTSYSGDQFVKSSSLSTIYNSDKSGQGIQVLGAKDFNESYLISFNNTSLPYSFTSSNAISAGTLAKVTSDGEGRTVEERSGLIKLDNLFLKASLGDLTFNGRKIEFKEPKDTLVNSPEHFMRSLETESIDVNNSGILTYTTSFEYSDSLKALSFLKEGSHAGFSVELFDAETGLVLKKLNSFTLIPSTLTKEHAQSFRLDLSGIGMKKVALRLSSDLELKDSTKAEYYVLRHYAVQRKAKKDNFVDLKYSEGARVTEYGLSQNYPNPFNPSTVINYQIPKASKVTLKIYDMLGKEVTTLVNEYKEQGKYSVEFNASSLPSGTYIYEIRADNFVKSGKMLLLK